MTPTNTDALAVLEGRIRDFCERVREGTFSVSDNGRLINSMQPGDWFGEIGLLKRSARTATVAATSDADVWCIPGETFLRSMQAVAMEPSELFDTMADRLARSARLGTVPASTKS